MGISNNFIHASLLLMSINAFLWRGEKKSIGKKGNSNTHLHHGSVLGISDNFILFEDELRL